MEILRRISEILNTQETRKEADALLKQAETSLGEGNVEAFEKQMSDAKSKMEEADKIDAAASQLKALQGEFNKPVNTVPIADKDVAAYDADDREDVEESASDTEPDKSSALDTAKRTLRLTRTRLALYGNFKKDK